MFEDNDSLKSISELDKILNDERKANTESSWNKLDKSTKFLKIDEFCKQYDTSEVERNEIHSLLINAIESNKLNKIKEVVYDSKQQKIIEIPSLIQVNGQYILKSEKRISTSKSLPHKIRLNSTKKKKHKIDNKDTST